MELETLYTAITLCVCFFIPITKLLFSSKINCQDTIHKTEKQPPSPPSLPFFGHMHLIKKPLHRTLEALSHQYGPILHMRFGSRPVLLVSSPSAVEECFTKNDAIFANRPHLLAAKHLNYNFSTLVSASYGPNWCNLRRFTLLEIFSITRLRITSSIRREEVHLFLRSLHQNNGSTTDFKQLEMKSKFTELVFNNMTKMIGLKRYYGEDVEAADLEEAKLFQEIMTETVDLIGSPYVGDYIPMLRWLDIKGVEKKMITLKKKRDTFLNGILDDRRRAKANDIHGVDTTTIDVLLSMQEKDAEYYTDEIIQGIIMVCFIYSCYSWIRLCSFYLI